jgi:hypothetical protein
VFAQPGELCAACEVVTKQQKKLCFATYGRVGLMRRASALLTPETGILALGLTEIARCEDGGSFTGAPHPDAVWRQRQVVRNYTIYTFAASSAPPSLLGSASCSPACVSARTVRTSRACADARRMDGPADGRAESLG